MQIDAESAGIRMLLKVDMFEGEEECRHSTVQHRIDKEGRSGSLPWGVSSFHAFSSFFNVWRVGTRLDALSGSANLQVVSTRKVLS